MNTPLALLDQSGRLRRVWEPMERDGADSGLATKCNRRAWFSLV